MKDVPQRLTAPLPPMDLAIKPHPPPPIISNAIPFHSSAPGSYFTSQSPYKHSDLSRVVHYPRLTQRSAIPEIVTIPGALLNNSAPPAVDRSTIHTQLPNCCFSAPSSPSTSSIPWRLSASVHSSPYVSQSRSNVRLPTKKAVVVGISYIRNPDFHLRGSSNDAHLFASSLVNLLGFDPSNIILLTDADPSKAYCSPEELFDLSATDPLSQGVRHSHFKLDHTNSVLNFKQSCPAPCEWLDPARVEICRINKDIGLLPTRQNILTAVNWLVKKSCSGDVLVFYFAGHGLQVDNMSGWEGEGYDEALLPLDYDDTPSGSSWNVLTTTHLKELLLAGHRDSQMTIFLDCVGGQTILDPAGTDSKWTYIKGLKQKGLWPILTDPTNKICGGNARDRVMYRVLRSKILSRFETHYFNKCVLLYLHEKPDSSACFAPKACGSFLGAWGQVCAEALFPSISLRNYEGRRVTEGNLPVIHGVFTYCLVSSLQSALSERQPTSKCLRNVSYRLLMAKLHEKLREIKAGRLSQLNQAPELTVCTGGTASPNDLFASFWGGNYRNSPEGTHYASSMLTDMNNEIRKKSDSLRYLTPQEAWLQLSTQGRGIMEQISIL